MHYYFHCCKSSFKKFMQNVLGGKVSGMFKYKLTGNQAKVVLC